MNIIAKLTVGSAVAMLLATGCTAPKNITYLQGFENGDSQPVAIEGRLTIQPDDRLSIIVSSKDAELAEIFNLMAPQRRLGMGSSSSSSSNSGTSSYTVDPEGYIEFPMLGRLKVAGMTRSELAKDLEKKLISNKLLNDAIATVEFDNAKFAVLGDVSSPGEYAFDRDRLTILQGISKAGDLSITGMRPNVLLVRREGDKDVAYRLDLTKTEQLMQSPAYYLQQNDVIYVEPNDTKKRQATVNGNTVLTPAFWLSVASFLTTISVLIFK